MQLFIRSSSEFWVWPTLNSSQEHWSISQSENYAIWLKRWPLNHIYGTMNSQFLGISLSIIAAWRLHRRVPIESATLVLIYKHKFYKTGIRLAAAKSSPRHGSHDPISAAARCARAWGQIEPGARPTGELPCSVDSPPWILPWVAHRHHCTRSPRPSLLLPRGHGEADPGGS
jgi:hypothetical protein